MGIVQSEKCPWKTGKALTVKPVRIFFLSFFFFLTVYELVVASGM